MLLLIAAWAAAAAAVTLNTTVGIQNTESFSSSIVLCNNTFSAANATGIFYTTPDFSKNARFGTALTLAQQQQKNSPAYGLQASLLIAPLLEDYLNSSKTGFDACAFSVNIVALSTNTWLRGQSDNGSCVQAFDSQCISDLAAATNALAVGSGTALCDAVYQKLTNSIPDSCQPYLASGNSFLNGYDYLTEAPGSDLSTLHQACKTVDNATWYNVLTEVSPYSDYAYDVTATLLWPIITVFFPSAKNSIITGPHTTFTCTHITKFNAGSRVTNITETPTPVATYTPQSKSIGGGAIAGIVVAGVAFIALVALGAWWFRSRRPRKKQEPEAIEIMTAEEKRDRKYSEVADTSIAEMSPAPYKAELPTHFSSELEGDHHYELEGNRFVHELPGTPVSKIR